MELVAHVPILRDPNSGSGPDCVSRYRSDGNGGGGTLDRGNSILDIEPHPRRRSPLLDCPSSWICAYPRGTAWTIAPRLAPKPAVVTAQFRRNVVTPDLVEGSDLTTMLFEQRIPITNKPRYEGRTVMLIDERAMSQAEHSGLFYRAANGTVFIGSPTQGVDGGTTSLTVPGGIRIGFSDQEVRWPDGRQLQRVGLTPDIEVRPTIAGIQAGRDEILERAVAFIENSKK